MNKAQLLEAIIARLSHTVDLHFTAAKTAHEAATHEETIPDNKYDTLALETSYLAQGQANRASDIRQALAVYKQLELLPMVDGEIRLTALVTLEAPDGATKTVFIGPLEGGMKLELDGEEVMVITPNSPLGSALLGRSCGDTVAMGSGRQRIDYEIVAVC